MMERYDAKRYRRILLLRAIFILTVWVVMFGLLSCSIAFLADEKSDYVMNFIFLLSVLTSVSDGWPDIKVFKVLKDNDELRRAWYAEHDEMRMAINARAGIPLMPYTAVGLCCAGLILALWSREGGLGMILAALCVRSVSRFAKIYWENKMSDEEEETPDEP